MARRTTDIIADLQDALTEVRAVLDELRPALGEDGDVGNADHVQEAYRSLDALDGHVGDIVP